MKMIICSGFYTILSDTVDQEVASLFSLTRWIETVLNSLYIYIYIYIYIAYMNTCFMRFPVLRISVIRIFGWKYMTDHITAAAHA